MQVERTRMYRVREVAGHFDVSVSTIYRAIAAGQIDALKLGASQRTLRVSGAAVLAYAEVCGLPGSASAASEQAAAGGGVAAGPEMGAAAGVAGLSAGVA